MLSLPSRFLATRSRRPPHVSLHSPSGLATALTQPDCSAEDSALALGEAFKLALGERRGIRRYGTGFAPLDEVRLRSLALPIYKF